jgi:SAM-dependent methyltransferase
LRSAQIASVTACEVCRSGNVALLRHSDRWDFDVIRCRDCGMVFVAGADVGRAEEVTRDEDPIDWDGYVSVMRADDSLRQNVLTQLQSRFAHGTAPVLFDVGAGAGDFLLLARTHGFDVTGNELSAGAIRYAQERHGLALSPLLLEDQPAQSVDVITMWCVVAHVADPRAFLGAAFEMLRPGGVLFLRTPRWCLIDHVGVRLDRYSRGRMPHIADRRVFPGHGHMFGAANMRSLLREIGYTEVQARPTCHYSLDTTTYIEGTGGVMRGLRRYSRAVDRMVEHNLAPRNALLVYASRPSADVRDAG